MQEDRECKSTLTGRNGALLHVDLQLGHAWNVTKLRPIWLAEAGSVTEPGQEVMYTVNHRTRMLERNQIRVKSRLPTLERQGHEVKVTVALPCEL